jgi:hypothetical protein
MLSRFKLGLGFVMVAAMLFAVGCSDDEDNATTSPAPQTSKVRVIHASYDAPAVDIRVDDAVAISGLDYGQSSGYAQVNAGTRNIKVTPAGSSTPIVIEANLPVDANKEYTIIAANELANIEPLLVEDFRAPNSSMAKVRFVHASPDAPAVDIKVGSGMSAPVFSNAAFRSISNYVEVNSGSYQFVVTAAGNTDEVLVFDAAGLQNGQVYTVVAHGTFDPTDQYPFAVRVFVDNDPGNAFVDLTVATTNVKVIHASPDAPGVDILVDDTVVNTAPLTFPNSTGYLQPIAGTRNIKVNGAGSSSSVINANVTFMSDAFYSVFAVNDFNNIEPLVLEDDLTPPVAGKAHVRFIHLSPDAPPVDITLTDGTIVFGNRSFKESTPFTPLDEGTYNLEVRLAGTSTVVLPLNGIMLEAGKIYTVFARGFVNGTGAQALNAEIIVNLQ